MRLKGKANEGYILVKEKVSKALAGQKGRSMDGLPPGQRRVPEMIAMPPVVSEYPHIPLEQYKLRIYGEVEREVELSFEELVALGVSEYMIDFHCVTRWSRMGQGFSGVDIARLVEMVRPKQTVKAVVFEGVEGYTANVVYKELLQGGGFAAVRMDGELIPDRFGGPVRMVVPYLYGWKSTKHLVGIRFAMEDEMGFWEVRGYHNHGDYWKEERYSG